MWVSELLSVGVTFKVFRQPPTKKEKYHKNRLMDPRLNERKKVLLQELSCILQELEEISAAQEMEEESVDSVVLCEHLCQPVENNEQLETPAATEHGMHNHIDQWFQSVLQPSDAALLQQILDIKQPVLLAHHALVIMHLYLLSKGMNSLLILLRRWLHWLFAYT